MILRTIFITLMIWVISVTKCSCQFKNTNWCFGDSAGINFSNPQNPAIFNSSVNSRGSCVSISDSTDSLLFYANTGAGSGIQKTLVYNRIHQLIVNGDNIIGLGWNHELLIIPDPANANLFYLFTAGVTTNYGLHYSIVDLTFNGGLGEVIQKNIVLQNFPVADGLTAVKHGNGRDWWIVFNQYDPNSLSWSNVQHSYLLTPNGISNLNSQNIGTSFVSGFHSLKFNKLGTNILAVDAGGLIELYDFDRCTGIFSNALNISPVSSAPFPFYWSSEFSPSGRYLYVSANPDTSYIFQYDLTASNIAMSKDTIWSSTFPVYGGGHLKIAPDSNIYYGTTYYNGFQFPYPYADSVYNIYNMNLGVIHEPDSGGTACNFLPWSFYLGGYRTYGGLPNNPDYELGPLAGSPCDSLTDIAELGLEPATFNLFYHSEWQLAFVNLSNIKGNKFRVQVYDITGKIIYKESGTLNSSYFTRDISMNGKARGMYVVRFETEKETVAAKFVVQ
jgi:hypothetical protein